VTLHTAYPSAGPGEVSEYGAKVWPDSSHGMCGDKVTEQRWDMPGRVQATYQEGQVSGPPH
jgi:hypothetical protein